MSEMARSVVAVEHKVVDVKTSIVMVTITTVYEPVRKKRGIFLA